jgi:hypothetical protein
MFAEWDWLTNPATKQSRGIASGFGGLAALYKSDAETGWSVVGPTAVISYLDGFRCVAQLVETTTGFPRGSTITASDPIDLCQIAN